MRKLILVGAIVLLALSPLTAFAQPKSTPAPTPPAVTEGVSSAKVLAIGVGALLGAVAGQALVVGDGVTLVGGVAGGLIAAWWYDNASTGPTRAAMREHGATPSLARAERLASMR